MGRYVSVQAYGDNNPKVVQVPYEQARGGRNESQDKPGRLKVEKVENIMGSTAGSGSGDFHTYRAHRRVELLRVEGIEKKYKEETEQEAFEASLARKRKECEERTQKNAEKRKRKKQKRQEAKDSKGAEDIDGSGDADEYGDAEVDLAETNDVLPVVQIRDDGSFLEMMKATLGSNSTADGGSCVQRAT